MLKRLLTIFIFLLTLKLFPQKAMDNINLASINYSLIDQLFNEKLNELRKSKGLSVLTADAILKKAAQDQADYILANDTLTHAQPAPNKKTPAARVAFYKGTHDGVGENCLFNFLNTPTLSKDKKTSSIINTYAEAAEQIFLSWKNSPGHYKNMIEPMYDVQGTAFSFNPATKKIVATQVFGVRPYSYDKKTEALLNDYNIKPLNPAICKALADENIQGIRVSNRIYVENDKVYLMLQNPKSFMKVFKDMRDKIAIDIVFKDQFTCEKNNRLNGSPYYDGLMLKPVSLPEIYKRNTGTHGRLNAFICDLPPEIKGKDYQLNVTLIRNDCFCSYTFPVTVERKNYDLINLQPFWDTVKTTLANDTFNLTIKQKIIFDKGKSEIDKNSLLETQAKLLLLGQFTKSIKLNAYSSVEGDELINKQIQEKRAQVIVKELQPFFPKSIKPEINAQENWDLFFKQIPDTKYYYLYALNKQQIKTHLKDSLKDPLEKQLNAERYSEFEIKIEGAYYDSSNADILSLGLMKMLNQKKLKLAHAIQSKLIYQYLNDKIPIDYISRYDFPEDTSDVPYVINLLAAKCINQNDPDNADKKKLIRLFKRYASNKKAQYNFCIYAINYWATKTDTLIHPKKLLELVENCKSSAPERAVNSLLLNYYLAAVKYYTYINDYDQMAGSLTQIHSLFQKTRLDENSSYKLALYFCGFNMTDWAVELLEPHVVSSNDERLLHLYLTAGAINYQQGHPQVYINALDKYVKMYPLKYTSWIKEEYQLLREPIFKTRYCDKKEK